MFLDDSDEHPRIEQRIEMTEKLIAPGATATFRVHTSGQTTVERVISLVLLGDLVSIYLAVLGGVDPGPIQPIEDLRQALAESS